MLNRIIGFRNSPNKIKSFGFVHFVSNLNQARNMTTTTNNNNDAMVFAHVVSSFSI